MDAGVRLAGGILLLAPVHAGLVGALVARLPLPRAFGRAAEHERAVAASGEEVRTATLAGRRPCATRTSRPARTS